MNTIRNYHSPFSRWHDSAAVRSMPTHDWLAGGAGAWVLNVDSILTHPEVLSHAEEVAIGMLLASLWFTVELENKLISPVALDIAHYCIGAEYISDLATDALRVHCDEAYHALLANELIGYISNLTGVTLCRHTHSFLRQIESLRQTIPQHQASLLYFCAALVSETLISKTLFSDRLNPNLQSDLRCFLNHHYCDELLHSAFFVRAFDIVWPQWHPSVQTMMSPLWSGLIDTFLSVDLTTIFAVLKHAGIAEPLAKQVVADYKQPHDAAHYNERSAHLTYETLRRAGAIDINP